ncbi:MAG TPA: hypothetical protein DCP41_12000 [Deltaproteobacteria bacterium]|nr:hypothetical protein [Deltaproteobacteria bacterium]
MEGRTLMTDPESSVPKTLSHQRLVRVFVSSTFRDMHAERDELVKFVFPELRRWCRERAVEFVEWNCSEDAARPAPETIAFPILGPV